MGWRRLNGIDRELAEYELRHDGSGGEVVVVLRDGHPIEYACRDLVHVRRVRDLELSQDEWSFFFRSGRSLVVSGNAGRKLAKRMTKGRRDVRVETHQPDAD